MRCTFDEIIKYGKKDELTGVLHVYGYEIGFIYYRTGF